MVSMEHQMVWSSLQKGEACKKLQNENRESVTIHPFVSFSGEVCMCHVIFAATGITAHMAPQEAVDKIQNLLISNTERGSQDHTSLLAAYKKFDQYLSSHNIVILSDGHTSRFDYEVLKFLKEKSMHLFLGPPDTTSRPGEQRSTSFLQRRKETDVYT